MSVLLDIILKLQVNKNLKGMKKNNLKVLHFRYCTEGISLHLCSLRSFSINNKKHLGLVPTTIFPIKNCFFQTRLNEAVSVFYNCCVREEEACKFSVFSKLLNYTNVLVL